MRPGYAKPGRSGATGTMAYAGGPRRDRRGVRVGRLRCIRLPPAGVRQRARGIPLPVTALARVAEREGGQQAEDEEPGGRERRRRECRWRHPGPRRRPSHGVRRAGRRAGLLRCDEVCRVHRRRVPRPRPAGHLLARRPAPGPSPAGVCRGAGSRNQPAGVGCSGGARRGRPGGPVADPRHTPSCRSRSDPVWRNPVSYSTLSPCHARVAEWQTRWLQVPVSERAWGFKSPLAHRGGEFPTTPAGWPDESRTPGRCHVRPSSTGRSATASPSSAEAGMAVSLPRWGRRWWRDAHQERAAHVERVRGAWWRARAFEPDE